MEFHHVRTASNSGTAMKPHDRYGISLCRTHHVAHHNGDLDFPLDLEEMLRLAERFFIRSPDVRMKESVRNAAVVEQ